MSRPPKQPGPNLIRHYALGAIFLVPLSIGVLLVTSNASQNDHANQISHDVGAMYAQGMDFSQPSNQDIALNVAEGLEVNLRAGQGVLILSKIQVVQPGACASRPSGKCTNEGHAVVTQRYTLGNTALRSSSFGTPDSVDSRTGNVGDWANDLTARADGFSGSLKPGESTYVAECYLASAEARGGVYSRAMF
ncbi:MAG TPA: hypothetical protein VMH80_11570 [Bryobacteraceae bacterium]|nr:hypothetical protein [Bryobacteraceae bacterium]